MREAVQSKSLTPKRVFNYFLMVCSSQLNTALCRRVVESIVGRAETRVLASDSPKRCKQLRFAIDGERLRPPQAFDQMFQIEGDLQRHIQNANLSTGSKLEIVSISRSMKHVLKSTSAKRNQHPSASTYVALYSTLLLHLAWHVVPQFALCHDLVLYGTVWLCIAPHGSSLLYVPPSRVIQLYMALRGSIWPHAAVYGSLWLYMAVSGSIWPYMANLVSMGRSDSV